MNRYAAFGKSIATELVLRLPPAPEGQEADLRIMLDESLPPLGPLPYSLGDITYGRNGSEISVRIPWCADFILSSGEIRLNPAPGSKQDMWALYITGLILMFHLRLSDILSFHGSALAVRKGAVAILGNQGSGKSTTAARLSQWGYPILCDDAIPVVPGPLVLPGIALTKLLPDAYERLIGDPGQAQALWDGQDKYQVPLSAHFEPEKLLAFILLVPDERAEQVSPRLLKGKEKFAALIPHLQLISGLDQPPQAFAQITGWLKNVPLWQIQRPTKHHTLDEVAAAIVSIINEAK